MGEVFGPLVTAGALALLMWRQVLHASFFPALLAAFVIWGMMRNVPGEVPGSGSTRAYFASLVSLLRKRALLVLVFVAILRSMGQSAILIFLPVYLREDLEYSAARVAIYLSMAQVVGIGAQPTMGYLSDRFGRKAVIIPAMTSLGLLILALRYADPGVQLVLTILALGAFVYSLHTIFIAAAMDIARGEIQATVVSMIYGASFLGSASPVLAGIIADKHGVPNAFLFAGSVVLLATFIMSLLKLPQTANQRAANR
jgi:predicted MFS family arabinose efflux permease